jgi:hypothetical protein
MRRFSEIRSILETAVQGNDIGAHGNFWRQQTRDQFVEFTYRGQRLVAKKADGTFDEEESGLVKALEGRSPFGRDTGTAGANFRRMPAGLSAVPRENIDVIRAWIRDGCPDDDLPILELMRQPLAQHDLSWLQRALQAAIELELATLPPYLCGQWAIQDQTSRPATLIKSIVLDEMGHLGLACNLLRATGAQPKILAAYDEIVYPGPLPGGVRPKCDPSFFPCNPHFHVSLGFTDFSSFAQMCMQIEYPEDPVPRPRPFALGAEIFPSIGEFYNAILSALQALDGTFSYQTDKQLQNDFPAVFVVDGLSKATEAISRIQKQGEGSSKFPFVDAQGTKLAHFYTFGEIYFGKKYVFDKAKQTGDWTGDPVTFPPSPVPQVFPMTPVPLGGYKADVPTGVADCDKLFTKMLQQLDDAWARGEPNALNSAIDSMIALKSKAIALLTSQIPRPEGGIYGPQFRRTAVV